MVEQPEDDEGAAASPHSLSDASSEDSDDDEVLWDAETDIYLFESMGRVPPIGANRPLCVLNSAVYLQKYLGKNVSEQQVYDHMKELYNIDALVLRAL